jgi:rhomboid protease GluP
MGEYDKAVEKYNQLIAQSAGDVTMGKNLNAKGLAAIGLCFLKQGKLAEAQGYFKKSIEMAIQIKPDWPDPYYRVALTYLNKGDNAKAAGNLEKFIKLEPETERKAQAKAILEAIKK